MTDHIETAASWFGPPDRPLFAKLYVPDDTQTRGAVVLCPAFGLEGICAGRTYRVLAKKLCRRGFVVMRIDYDGTGDSAGSEADPRRVDSWIDSVRRAVDYLRSCGSAKVSVVGMRFGATVAAAAAPDCGLDALVLWDPCVDGRSFLREQRALFAMKFGSRPDGESSASRSGEALGVMYWGETVADMERVAVNSVHGDLARRVLVLTRPERRTNPSMRQRLSMPHVDWGHASGQNELIGVEPFEARVPSKSVDTISEWLSSVIDPGTCRVSVALSGRATVESASGQDREVVETIVSIGDVGLFGILAQPPQIASGVTMVLLNAGLIDHVGPSRLWVTLSRRWAKAGLSVLRVDLSGIGDSPARPGQAIDVPYPREVFEDLELITHAVSPTDPSDIVLAGLCSGAYHAVEGALTMDVRGICALNPILAPKPSEIDDRGATLRGAMPDSRRQANATRKAWVRKLPAHDLLWAVVNRLPEPAWWLIDLVGVDTPPVRSFEKLVERGVDTFVLCGDREIKDIRRGQNGRLRRLQRSSVFHLQKVPGTDHELFGYEIRQKVEAMVTTHVLDHFAPATQRQSL